MVQNAQVQILNDALGHLGQDPVADLSPTSLQGSGAATKLMRFMEQSRQTVLSRHGWLCALEYVQLTAATIPGYTNFAYPYVFKLPGNALRVWSVGGWRYRHWRHRRDAWEMGSLDSDVGGVQILLAHREGPLDVAYVRQASWGALTVQLVDAVGFDLAARGCMPVTMDKDLKDRLDKRAEQALLLAISVDATQMGNQAPIIEFETERLRYECW